MNLDNYVAFFYSRIIEEKLLKEQVLTLNMANKFDKLNRATFQIHTVDKKVDNSVDKMKKM